MFVANGASNALSRFELDDPGENGEVLNIGKLGAAAAEYYVGEVATSAEDYYTGRGESAGRWVGSLAAELGLVGEVDPEHFRRVLNGKDPFTGEYLVTARGSATRAATRRKDAVGVSHGEMAEQVDTLRAAAYLGVSAQYVRRLLGEGERHRQRLAEAADGEQVVAPSAYLLGEKSEGAGRFGGDTWTVSRGELERFAATRRESKARPGYDLTLRPPKSVSVLWALGTDEQRVAIRQAHAEAVDEVVRYYETNAVFARSGSGDRRLLATAGVIAAAFDHRSSRAGDPLLHTHVVTANMTTFDGVDGTAQWRALAGTGLYEHARTAGYLYQAHLRHLLVARLGVAFAPVVNGHAEIVGVPEDVIGIFSKRRTEIEEVLTESANTSARAAQVATLDTRRAKDYGVEPETLTRRWQTEATEAGFGPEQVSACFDRGSPERLDPERLDSGRIEGLYETLAGAHGLTERAATFSRTDVIEAISSAIGAAATARKVEELADGFLQSDRALFVDRTPPVPRPLGNDGTVRVPVRVSVRRSATQKLYTTPELARIEEQILAWATHGFGPPGPVVAGDEIDGVLVARPELSAEQSAMTRAACTAGESMQVIAGRPGAGKTYATEAIVAAHVGAGVAIVGCAVSATAAAELESAAGFARSTGRPATTIARLLLELDEVHGGGLAPGGVILIDEASMVATRDLARLAEHARRARGALKLVGDPDQHGSVDVGGVFRRLCADRGDSLVRLVDNNRQEDHAERLAVADYREGHVAEARSECFNAASTIHPVAGAG